MCPGAEPLRARGLRDLLGGVGVEQREYPVGEGTAATRPRAWHRPSWPGPTPPPYGSTARPRRTARSGRGRAPGSSGRAGDSAAGWRALVVSVGTSKPWKAGCFSGGRPALWSRIQATRSQTVGGDPGAGAGYAAAGGPAGATPRRATYPLRRAAASSMDTPRAVSRRRQSSRAADSASVPPAVRICRTTVRMCSSG